MVKLTRIYTRTGDAGTTRLADNAVASKTDPRLEAYGDVDEANSTIGVALAAPDVPADIAEVLAIVQNELFDGGADLAAPVRDDLPYAPIRVRQAGIDRLEGWCDRFNEPLAALSSFVLPGGCPLAAQLHVARTRVRRAERAAWAAAQEYGLSSDATPDTPATSGGVSALAIRYLNRASDLLFILARYANHLAGAPEPLWHPAS
jgi:cob(I)alamin adenosyltransferase